MFLFLVELILGAAAVWHGRRWLVARLDETFGNSPEFFEDDDPHILLTVSLCIVAFFGTLAVLALGFPSFRTPILALLFAFAAVSLTWVVGNLSNWRRLEPGNPLREALDSVLSLDGKQPTKVWLRRGTAKLPLFTLDGALEIPNAFARSVPFDEQRFLYQIVRNQSGIVSRTAVIFAIKLGVPLLIVALAVVFLRFPSWFVYFFLPLFHFWGKDFSNVVELEIEECQKALLQTGDFAAAERAIYRSLPVKTADERVAALREWWAMQSPANPTVAAMRNASVSPTQRVGLGP